MAYLERTQTSEIKAVNKRFGRLGKRKARWGSIRTHEDGSRWKYPERRKTIAWLDSGTKRDSEAQQQTKRGLTS